MPLLTKNMQFPYFSIWKKHIIPHRIYGILKNLQNIGLKGHLPNFFKSFLSNRYFNVRLGSTISDNFAQEMGVPQGSILSVTLFSLKIVLLMFLKMICMAVYMLATLFFVTNKKKTMNSIERQLQLCLQRIQSWADENGFRFSKTITTCVHFCSKRKLHEDPCLQLDGNKI